MVKHFNIPFIIGTGSGGGKIISKLIVKMAKIAVNSSWKDLDALPEEVVKVRAGGGHGSGMDPKQGEKDYVKLGGREGLREAIEKVLSESGLEKDQVDLIPVVISAGHGFGSGSGPKIVEDLRKWFPKTPIIAFITSPFAWEGYAVLFKANQCFEKVAEHAGTIVIDNNYIAQIAGGGESIPKILMKADNYISSSIEVFLKIATSQTILAGIDRTDLMKVCDRGSILLFNRVFKKDEPIENIFDSDSMLNNWWKGKVAYTGVKILALIQSPVIHRTIPEKIFKASEDRFGHIELFKPAMFQGESFRLSLIVGGVKYFKDVEGYA